MIQRLSNRAGVEWLVFAAATMCALCTTLAAQSAPPQAARTPARVQAAGNAGTITGVVTDPSGAVVPNATVTLSNAVSGFSRNATTDPTGAYTLSNIPFNTYRLSV